MLMPDERDPVYDREAAFCGRYEPLFKYAPMPMPPGSIPASTYPPARRVDDPADTTCVGEDCDHPCEMDCLRACDSDAECYGFSVSRDAADPKKTRLFCRMIREEGVLPQSETVEAEAPGAVSYRKVLDGSGYDPLGRGGECKELCGPLDNDCPFASAGGPSEADAALEMQLTSNQQETDGAKSISDNYKENSRLFGKSPNKGRIEYGASTINQCAVKCDEAGQECVMFTWNPFAETSALTGRKAGCRLLSTEDHERASYANSQIKSTGWNLRAGRKDRVSVQNFEKKNWDSLKTTSSD
jgi:hypothetical protein